ncbi:MAG: efflux RND transporter periplasmic adaptor subunit [Treponema sp.]|nr:efflux RND transporter periplasmic adaptor subunit [Treponema sp.]
MGKKPSEKQENSSSAKRGSKAPLIIIGACVLVIVAVAVYAAAYKKKSASGPGAFGADGPQGTVTVRTIEAAAATLHDFVNTNGEIEPQSSIDVFPDIGGKIVDVSVSLGSTVRRGDVIAEIDPSVPGTEYRHSMVTAPVSGTITRTPLKPGTTVNVASTITVIGDVTNLQLTASIPERYVASLRTGLKADIILEAYPHEVFTATVTRVSPLVDSTSRTKEIILNFDKKDQRINAGMFAKVRLWTQDYSGKITVPSNAVVEKNNRQNVYIIKDGTAELRPVTTGNSVEDEIQILSGVDMGERIVIEGMRVLSDGARVRDLSMPSGPQDTGTTQDLGGDSDD